MKRGFTVVELLITMTIMAVLLGLGVVSIRSILISGRDNERASDIATIARGLEQFHKNGNPFVSQTVRTTAGTYPGVYEFLHMAGTNYCGLWGADPNGVFLPCAGGNFEKGLPGVNTAALNPPDMSTSSRNIFVKGELGTQNDAAVLDKLNAGYYVYIPIDINDPNNTCLNVIDPNVSPCLAYILKYKKEATGEIIQVKSRYQQ